MRLVTPIWFKRLFRKPKTGSDEVAIYVKTDNKVYKRLPNNGDEVELGGGIELVKLNNTYYGVGESVGGVLQPQDNIKTSTTNPVGENILNTYVYKADGRLDYYTILKSGVTKKYTPTYNGTEITQIDEINVTIL